MNPAERALCEAAAKQGAHTALALYGHPRRYVGPVQMADIVRQAVATVEEQAPVMGRISVLPLVLADLQARVENGTRIYGEPLTTRNGRFALQDAYEEALDLSMYLKQAIEESKP